MAFGDLKVTKGSQGLTIIIPYDGAPSVWVFIPHATGEQRRISIGWRGVITPGATKLWLYAVFGFEEAIQGLLVDWWNNLASQPKHYTRDNLEELIADVTSRAPRTGENRTTVTIAALEKGGGAEHADGERYYVWGELSGDTGYPAARDAEVGIRLVSPALETSRGRALVTSLLRHTLGSPVTEWDAAQLVDQLRTRVSHADSATNVEVGRTAA